MTLMDTPQYYHPDRQLRIHCAGGHVVLTIVQAFLPFTTSQVLLTRLEENLAQIPLPVGAHLIVKVYDTRFIHHRTVFGKPWSYAAEEAAARRHGGISKPDAPMPSAPDTDDAVDWEEFYFRQGAAMFWSEVKAYERLESMQDLAVPRLYGVGGVDLSDMGCPRAVAPPVLLMQYIADARSLEDLDPHLISRPLLDSALQTVQKLTVLGVLHGELNGSEILCYPAHHPVHAFFIDFGNSRSRKEGEGNEQWAEAVLEAGDFRWVEMLFHLHAERGRLH